MAPAYNNHTKTRPMETRSKYKEAPDRYVNITYDRRIVRGNTYGQHLQPDPAEIQRQQEYRRKTIALKRAQELLSAKAAEALQGRKHIEVQTDRYLEELSYVIVTSETECQTDAFLDRPASPLFIPSKSGSDVGTQIEEGELFDFDREVQPVVEVLVGKTIEQSLLEVMEEEELACLKAQQSAFIKRRNIHLADVQRLQEMERRHIEEKERRIAEQKEVLRKEKETADKIAARAYTMEYLADLVPAAFSSLRCNGFLDDPVQTDIETHFLPWLMDEVNSNLERRYSARQLLDNIIHDVAQERLAQFKEQFKETEPDQSDV